LSVCSFLSLSFEDALHSSQPSHEGGVYDRHNSAPYMDVSFVLCAGTPLRPLITASLVLKRDVPLRPRNPERTLGDIRPSSVKALMVAHWNIFRAAGWGESSQDIAWEKIFVQEARRFPLRHAFLGCLPA
jgi:hypothetical protein